MAPRLMTQRQEFWYFFGRLFALITPLFYVSEGTHHQFALLPYPPPSRSRVVTSRLIITPVTQIAMTLLTLALAAFCALPRSQCADFDLIADILQASVDKTNSFDPGRFNDTGESAMVIGGIRKKLCRDLHVLEQGLLSGNEGRMSALISKVKSSVDSIAAGFDSDPSSVSDAWLQTASSVLQVLHEVERMLQGDTGWTPSWHYISQFLDSFLNEDYS